MTAVDRLAQRLGVTLRDTRLLRVALVHRSFINEHPEREPDLESNERLEFLGDSIVNAAAAILLYERFPSASEGDLTTMRTELIKTSTLAELARGFEIGRYMRLGKGEESSGARDRDAMLADMFEAIIAAIYLDGGFEAAQRWLTPLFDARIAQLVAQGRRLDHKSRLQEQIQAERGVTPHYRTIATAGPEHRREFTVQVFAAEELLGEGSGPSKQAAEQAAAQAALERLDERAR
jgi:ribonuclease III